MIRDQSCERPAALVFIPRAYLLGFNLQHERKNPEDLGWRRRPALNLRLMTGPEEECRHRMTEDRMKEKRHAVKKEMTVNSQRLIPSSSVNDTWLTGRFLWRRRSSLNFKLISFSFITGRLQDYENIISFRSDSWKKEIASVRLGPKTLRTLDEEVKSLVSAWRSSLIIFS